MNSLFQKKCVPCEGGVLPLKGQELGRLLSEVHVDWELEADRKIRREFRMRDFKGAIEFVNKVAVIAEEEGHHPDIHIVSYRNVILELWTHAIEGLSENDFIMAAKIDALRKV